MIERFLLYRVDAKSRTSSIGSEIHLPIDILSYETEAAVAVLQDASPRTEIAEYFLLIDLMPVSAWHMEPIRIQRVERFFLAHFRTSSISV